MSAEEEIREAARVEEFLNDDVIQGALGRLERLYYEEFKLAMSDEARVMAQAKARVRDDVVTELQRIVRNGEHAVMDLQARARHQRSTT